MTITIDRGTWLTEKVTTAADVDSRLYDPTTKMMCCLGFAARQCGIARKRIAGVEDPVSVCGRLPAAFSEMLLDNGYNNDLATDAMHINDSRMPNSRREARLTSLFKRHGHRIIFRGVYPTRQELKELAR